jgi:hypothetical protein
LVPLDRTSFAEQAMPLALGIARRASARLDLVKVHALYALEDRTAAEVASYVVLLDRGGQSALVTCYPGEFELIR